jgi:ABC-2 type transport system permease protein
MAGNIYKKINKIFAEIGRGFALWKSYKIFIISDFISTPFWIYFFILAILIYAQHLLNDKFILTNLMWGLFMFFFISSFLWMGTSIVLVVQTGILENIILTNTKISTHLLGRSVVSVIDVTTGGIILILMAYYTFNLTLYIADPLFFAIFLILAFLFFLFFSTIYAILIIASRSPWIITNILQFIIPFFSGAIPIQMFKAEIANVIIYSPFFYAVGPVVAAATGYYIMDKYLLLILASIMVLIAFLISNYLEKLLIKKALKEGKMSLF